MPGPTLDGATQLLSFDKELTCVLGHALYFGAFPDLYPVNESVIVQVVGHQGEIIRRTSTDIAGPYIPTVLDPVLTNRGLIGGMLILLSEGL